MRSSSSEHWRALLALVVVASLCSPGDAETARAESPEQAAQAAPGNAAVKDVVKVEIFPAAIDLTTGADRQSIVVLATHEDGTTTDLTTLARRSLGDAKIARLDGAFVKPVGDGETLLRVEAGRSSRFPYV